MGWAEDVLRARGLPATPTNLGFMQAWQNAEGGHTKNDATWNWLNTTRGSQYPSMNSVGVRQFPNYQTGVQMTAETLGLPYYKNVVGLLAQGNAPMSNLAQAVYASPWGTKRGIASVTPVSATGPGPSSARTAQVSPPQGGQPPPSGLAALLSKASGERDRAAQTRMLLGFLLSGGRDQQQATPVSPPAMNAAPSGSGGFLDTSHGWKPTHVTSGLGWGTKTAGDLMANPGTSVGAPENGVIVRHGSAQGGSSLYLRGDSGATYWLGHIEGALPVGTRVNAGQPIAVVSSDHAAPHLHIDRRVR